MGIFGGKSESSLAEENRKLEKACSQKESECRKLEKGYSQKEAEIREIERALTNAKSQIHQAEFRIREMKKEHHNIVTKLNDDYEAKIERLTRQHSTNTDEAENKYRKLERDSENNLLNKQKEYDSFISKLKLSHQAEVERLRGQLITPPEENQGWPDDKLKKQYGELQRLIDDITSPSNKQFNIGPGQRIGSQLDPTDFCGRKGNESYDFLLKNILWTILREQFFSRPFGFGALGPGEGYQALMKVFYSWREVFEANPRSALPDDRDLDIFKNDALANKWRCATFKSIQESVMRHIAGNHNASKNPLVKFSTKNYDQAVNRILATLKELSELSGHRDFPLQTEIEVRKATTIACQIALQLGVHSAQLIVYAPNRGEKVCIGKEYLDCMDGAEQRGKTFVVDLVVVPSFQKIGDGRADMTTKRTIVPCEIYPLDT